MTIKELSKLSDEELRVRCAEVAGWTLPVSKEWTHWGSVDLPCGRPPSGEPVWATLPNYPSDLNAMHEAEKTLSNDEGAQFRFALSCNSDGPKSTFRTVEAAMCHATARQRCIAFIAVKQSA